MVLAHRQGAAVNVGDGLGWVVNIVGVLGLFAVLYKLESLGGLSGNEGGVHGG